MRKGSIPFLHFARGKLLIDIQMKFQKNILNGFQLREQTRFYDKVQKEIITKRINARVMVLAFCFTSSVD